MIKARVEEILQRCKRSLSVDRHVVQALAEDWLRLHDALQAVERDRRNLEQRSILFP